MTKDVFDMDVVDHYKDDHEYDHDDTDMMMDYYEVKVSKNKKKNGKTAGGKNSRKQSKTQTQGNDSTSDD